MSPTTARLVALCSIVVFAVSGCAGSETPGSEVSPTGGIPPNGPTQPRAQLAARAAAAKDQRQVAFYLWKSPGRADRQVSVTRATDGSWRIDIPGGAHGGTIDISLVQLNRVLFQCAPAGCVRIEKDLPSKADPRIQRLFTNWLEVLTDRQLALSVAPAAKLQGIDGDCYALESSAVSVKLPMDAGIYCYRVDGTLTGARLSVGTLTLVGKPNAAPPTVTMPGPVVPGQPLPLAAPPAPSPSTSATPAPVRQ